LSFVPTPCLSEISHISKEEEGRRQAQAYALYNVAFSSGFLVGPLWGGFLVNAKGWDVLVTSLTAIAAAGIPPALIWTGGPLKWRNLSNVETVEEMESKA
jgi:MFS family permease